MKQVKYSGVFKVFAYVMVVMCVTVMWISAHTLIQYDVGNIMSADTYTKSNSYEKKRDLYLHALPLNAQAREWLDHNNTLEDFANAWLVTQGVESFTEYNAGKEAGDQKLPASFEKEYAQKKAENEKLLNENPLPGAKNNFRYVIYETKSGTVVATNLDSTQTGTALAAQVAGLNREGNSTSGESGSYSYLGAVDETFPMRDEFFNAKLRFESNLQKKSLMPPAFAGLTLGALIALWLLWYLFAGAGLRQKGDRVHMSYFDRIYTEIFYAAATALGFITYGLGYFCTQVTDNPDLILLWKVLFVTVGAALGLSVLLSTFKRVRTGAFVYDSLFYRLFVLATRRWSATGRMILVTVSMAIIGMAMVGVACIHSTVAIVLALSFHGLLDIAVIAGFICWATQTDRIRHGLKKIVNGNLEHKIGTGAMVLASREIATNINRITQSMQHAVEEQTKSERLKSELITNVSHDIKTPLTSIINYVDLLKKEDLQGEHVKEYLDVLDNKSQRLKALAENLVEASKASTGNVTIVKAPINMNEMTVQAIGEFQEKFTSRDLTIISTLPETTAVIYADGRYVWRIIENLFSNAFKYALEHTRVYVDLVLTEQTVGIEVKNISQQRLNISADELMERFVRGDSSRNTQIEGSGLGLSIAQNLTQIQGGNFKLTIDGDLFKAEVVFPVYNGEQEPPAAK